MSEIAHRSRGAHLRLIPGSLVRRVLVVANQTATSAALISELEAYRLRGSVELRLVVPALNGRLGHWLSDTDGAVAAARRRAEQARAILALRGIAVAAEIGDSVPLLAIEDALARFDADEILISTLPPGRSHWLEQDVVELARERFAIPVRHVVAHEDRVLLPTHSAARYHGARERHHSGH
ncbi:MAG: hypothetical protein FWD04_08865 [Conexibacteraceae bacterium]|nr:hypothetical protein [Conexibacteraceae bacterium]